jgi:hypothetical protein
MAEVQSKPAKERILALDILRGYFILIIASVHLHYYPSLFGSFDGRGQLWVSEAEGFFFISGLLIGIIRKRDIIKRGLATASYKILQRGWKLYLTAAILSSLYLYTGRHAAAAGISGVKDGLNTSDSFWHVLGQIFTLQYSYGWADFLVYYAAFMLIGPLVLWLLKHRAWWAVLGLSLAAWIWRWTSDHGTLNPFLQWQVYFFGGAVIGYYWETIRGFFVNLPPQAYRQLQNITIAAAGLFYLLSVVLVFIPEAFEHRQLGNNFAGHFLGTIIHASDNEWYQKLLVDGRIGLLRPLILLITITGAYWFVRRHEAGIKRRIGWLLIPFGQNSLYVYILESLLLFIIPFVLPVGSFVRNSLIEVGIVTMVWLAVRKRFLFRLIPR